MNRLYWKLFFNVLYINQSINSRHLRPNLKNLSSGLNLSRGLIMVVSLKIVSNVSRSKSALNLNRVLADLSRDLNSLNLASGLMFKGIVKCKRNLKWPFIQKCLWKSTFVEKQQNKVTSFKKQKKHENVHNWSDNFVG